MNTKKGFYYKDNRLPVRTCHKPKMTWHRGRTWDYGILIINDKEVKTWGDTTWGRNIYFSLNGKWYTLPMFSEMFKVPEYDFDIFAYPHPDYKITFNN